MSTLRSALDELRTEDLLSLSDDGLADRVDEIERAGRILEAERGRGLAELERRRVFAADGHLSAAAWLAHRQGLSRRSAEGAIRRARALEAMPDVARAFGDGDVSESVVHMLASAQEAAPEAFARSETAFVEAARTMAFDELRRVTETWRMATDPEQALEDEDRRHEWRRLDVCPTANGMTCVQGELDAEAGQGLITAIRAQMDAEARSAAGSDARTPAQRRADALSEICRRWLDARERPTIGGERPHIVVTIDLENLIQRSGRRSELEDTFSITPETARRLACDADVTRMIVRGASEPLELGRRTKVVPPALRRAIAVRDRGCRFPGCGPGLVRRPPRPPLGRRRRDLTREPGPSLPAAPPHDPPRLRRRDAERSSCLFASGRYGAGRTRTPCRYVRIMQVRRAGRSTRPMRGSKSASSKRPAEPHRGRLSPWTTRSFSLKRRKP